MINGDLNQQNQMVSDLKRIRLEADEAKTKPLKEQVEFILGKENPTQVDILDYVKSVKINFRSIAFFLDDSKFNDFVRLFPVFNSGRKLEHGGAHILYVGLREARKSELRFFIRVTRCFPKGARPLPPVQTRIVARPEVKKVLERKEVSITLPDCLHKTELDKKEALEALNEVMPNIQKVVYDTEILLWDKFENTKNIFFDNYKISGNIIDKIDQITPKGTHFERESCRFWNFPSLRIECLTRGVLCLDWITCVQTIAEVSLGHYIGESYLGRYFLAHYIGPQVTGMEQHTIFLTPLRLMECLTKGAKEADGVEKTGHHDKINEYNKKLYKETVYSVRGYPKEVKLPDTFMEWVLKFSERKGLKDFSDKMQSLGVMDAGTYDMVVSKIESKIEPRVEGPILSVKDTERLRIIKKVVRMPSLGQWVKAIKKYGGGEKGVIFKSTQGFSDFLHRMEAGGYIKVHRDKSGVWIELTEKGLRAIE